MKRTFLAVLMGVCVGLFAACGVEAPVEESPPTPAQQSAAVCSGCGDGVCTWCDGDMCPEECGYCGDAVCAANESAFGSCPQDCTPTEYCGDGVCNGYEDWGSCSQDCRAYCGDGYCNESRFRCPQDCGSTCLIEPCERTPAQGVAP